MNAASTGGTAHYAPIAICAQHKTSFHLDLTNEIHHRANYHSPEFPCNIRLATKDEHDAAGWDTTDYPYLIG